ncbi:nickel transporter [Streptomyces sp. JJ66]|uniref:nickel transporter n=1 Tax=Streptomyces sp. JJ66 TaxID=2803843 RepID=UPI001C5C2155|nr:nickel transporter [Streptomyces sp. JJ66]MBW1601679.1 nickel transporter [Streptomyces sp. JJ66]
MTTGHHRRLSVVCALLAALCAGTLATAWPATAHPLGNFTVNHYLGLRAHPEGVETTLVVDSAEIAAAQERGTVDADGDGTVSAAERTRYATGQCAARARDLHVTVNGERRPTRVADSSFSYRPGEAGLRTSRLECALRTPADLAAPAQVSVTDTHSAPRIGWHELTATGDGVTLTDSTAPATSLTDELRQYPDDLLAEPLDLRTAELRTTPGASASGAPGTAPTVASAGPFSSAFAALSDRFTGLVGERELTVPIGLLALTLAVVLGASHAVLPGHGKTIMAAYLAGRQGRVRDAVTVGATVTLTHTAGVLVVGLLLPLVTTVAGETVLGWLTLVSGALVTVIGLSLLRAALRGHTVDHHHHHAPGHGHHGHGRHEHHHGPGHHHGRHKPKDGHHQGHEDRHHPHHPGHGAHPAHEHPSPDTRPHSHPHEHAPSTSLPVPHSRKPVAPAAAPSTVAVLTEQPEPPARPDAAAHTPSAAPEESRQGTGRRGLIGIGIAGGLVPSPSALVVLLGAVALGRTPFGVLLVLGYGVGMAATLTAAGVLLVRFRDHAVTTWSTRLPQTGFVRRVSRLGAPLTAAFVVLVGLALTLRALTTPW